MKKTVMLVVGCAIGLAWGPPTVSAQAQGEAKAPMQASASVGAEVNTPEDLLAAIYAAISGPAGERDWVHFRALFLPQARLTATRDRPEGVVVISMSVDDYVTRAGDYFKKEGFYEKGVVNHLERYGRVVQAFSSYESRHAPGEKPFARGINSVQMMRDGTRWWVVSIAWDEERADNPLPKEFSGQ